MAGLIKGLLRSYLKNSPTTRLGGSDTIEGDMAMTGCEKATKREQETGDKI
jgi:hypothetical protein